MVWTCLIILNIMVKITLKWFSVQTSCNTIDHAALWFIKKIAIFYSVYFTCRSIYPDLCGMDGCRQFDVDQTWFLAVKHQSSMNSSDGYVYRPNHLRKLYTRNLCKRQSINPHIMSNYGLVECIEISTPISIYTAFETQGRRQQNRGY